MKPQPARKLIYHLRLIRSDEYREVIADRLAALPGGEMSFVTVVHEDDDSCCRMQPWAETWNFVLQTAAERRGLASVVVRVSQP